MGQHINSDGMTPPPPKKKRGRPRLLDKDGLDGMEGQMPVSPPTSLTPLQQALSASASLAISSYNTLAATTGATANAVSSGSNGVTAGGIHELTERLLLESAIAAGGG